MDHVIAQHILASQSVAELNDVSSLLPSQLDAADAADVSRQYRSELREASAALGVKFVDAEGLSQGKQRLMAAMAVAAEMAGQGADGAYVRGGDFHGAAGAGALSGAALSDIVNPDRPHQGPARWTFGSGASGSLQVKSSASKVSKEGLVAVGPARLASIAVGKVESALGGFEPVWEAVAACSENKRRLGALGGPDPWSKQEISTHVEAALASRLEPLPLGPGSSGFPKELESAGIGAKLAARREAVPQAPKVSGPKAAA